MENILSSICEFVNGKICLDELNESTYISTENMLPNRGGITKASSLPSTTYSRLFLKEDVLVSNIRPYFKKIWIAKFDGGCSNDVLVFRAKSHIDSKFLYYLLSDDSFFEYATLTAKGTKMPRGDKIAIMNYEIPIFPLKEQQKISKTLSSLDEKIEINRKINENLEEQAKEIFKRWFVDYEFPNEEGQPYKSSGGEIVESELGLIPKGWEKINLGDICICELGGTPSRKKNEYWNGNIPWINSGSVNLFRIIKANEMISESGLKKSSTKLLPKKTTVIAITGSTLGQVSLLEIDSCTNQSVVGVIPNKNLPYEFIYPYIKANIDELLSHKTGGAQQHINSQNVKNLKVIVPNKKSLEQYTDLISPIYEMISKNCFEIEYISSIRDTLLPKLMTGEIDVSKIDI